MQNNAVISGCGRYRYRLTRQWDNDLPELCFIMLNPSTADATLDDPTIRRCIGFAKSLSYGRLDVVNLFAYRATKPADLWDFDAETEGGAAGELNDHHILDATRAAQTTICAWGGLGSYCRRDAEVKRMLVQAGVQLHALRINKDGSPAHPLYLPAKLQPITLH